MLDVESLAPDGIRPLLRSEYDAMVERGMFDGEPLELLRGALVTMSPQGDRHLWVSHWFVKRLTLALGEPWNVIAHSPYAATNDSEPEPDVAVCPATGSFGAHPSKAVLIIEVANSSLSKDRRVKASIYADANVPEYWIVDISGEALRIEVHTEPTAQGYRHLEILGDGDVLRPTSLRDIEIAVREIPWDRR